jgi:hypothetical protein
MGRIAVITPEVIGRSGRLIAYQGSALLAYSRVQSTLEEPRQSGPSATNN